MLLELLAPLLLGVPLALVYGATWQHTPRSRLAQADLERALARTGLTVQQQADAQQIDEAQWRRQVKGVMGATPSAYRLAECPEAEAEYIRARAPRHNLIVLHSDKVGAVMEFLARLVEKKPMARLALRAQRGKVKVSA